MRYKSRCQNLFEAKPWIKTSPKKWQIIAPFSLVVTELGPAQLSLFQNLVKFWFKKRKLHFLSPLWVVFCSTFYLPWCQGKEQINFWFTCFTIILFLFTMLPYLSDENPGSYQCFSVFLQIHIKIGFSSLENNSEYAFSRPAVLSHLFSMHVHSKRWSKLPVYSRVR